MHRQHLAVETQRKDTMQASTL